MKPHFKPPANHLQPAFRASRLALFSLLFTLFSLHSPASVPLAWQVTPRNPAPVAFDRHHGETLELRCTFTGFGELPFDQAADIRLWYQTNGMATAWWSVPATISSNVLAATFPPQADPGADRLALFFGAPSNVYASAVLRLRPSPGCTPNVLPPPDTMIWATELAAVRALVDYSPSNAALIATIAITSPRAGNYEIVSNRAMSAIQNEQDPTVPAWAKSATPPASMTTNDVKAIVTNEVNEKWAYVNLPNEASNVWIVYLDGMNLWTMGFTLDGINYEGAVLGQVEDLRVEFECRPDGGDTVYKVTATRPRITRNELGFARLSDLPPLTNELPEVVAAAVYDVHDLRWDEEEQILYWCKFVGGHDLCIAVTNINLTHPTNAVLLKKWRETNR